MHLEIKISTLWKTYKVLISHQSKVEYTPESHKPYKPYALIEGECLNKEQDPELEL